MFPAISQVQLIFRPVSIVIFNASLLIKAEIVIKGKQFSAYFRDLGKTLIVFFKATIAVITSCYTLFQVLSPIFYLIYETLIF